MIQLGTVSKIWMNIFRVVVTIMAFDFSEYSPWLQTDSSSIVTMVTTKPKLKGPPPDMEVPDDIALKRSGVDPERIGKCCQLR